MNTSMVHLCRFISHFFCAIFVTVLVHADDLSAIIQQARSNAQAAGATVKALRIIEGTRTTSRGKKGTAVHAVETTMVTQGARFSIETAAPATEGDENGAVRTDTGARLIFDGANTWAIENGRAKAVKEAPEDAPFFVRKPWWEILDGKAEITQMETVRGRSCYVINNRNAKSGDYSRIWVARDSLLPVQAEQRIGRNVYRSIFSDFRTVKKTVHLPFKIERFMNGAPQAVTAVRSVEINPDLPADFFSPEALPSGTAGSPAP